MLHKLLQQPHRLPPSRIPLAVAQLLQDDPFSCKAHNSSHLLPKMPIAWIHLTLSTRENSGGIRWRRAHRWATCSYKFPAALSSMPQHLGR